MSERPNNPEKPQGEELAKAFARIAHDNRAENIVVLDLRGLSPVADFFVLATGTSDRQNRAIIDNIADYADSINEKRYGQSGYESATWILADYVDVVVHVFDADKRRFYDLELLWGDAPRIDWQNDQAA